MVSKICSKCKQEKSIEYFHKRKDRKSGYLSHCKICINNRNQIYYLIHKDNILDKVKIYYKNNRPKKIIYSKNYNNTHKLQRRIYHKMYVKNKIKIDPKFKLIRSLRRRMLLSLKGGQKSAPTEKLLGCSFQQFNDYFKLKMTPDMSWQDYLDGKIHIDHIRPCSSFNLADPDQQRQCFHYTNLQPLWAADNLSKSNKYSVI